MTKPDETESQRTPTFAECLVVIARLTKERDDLIKALAGLEVLFRRDGENSLETFERIAAEFQKDTGYLRPGKDCPFNSPEVRQAAYDTWIDNKLVAARTTLQALKGTE